MVATATRTGCARGLTTLLGSLLWAMGPTEGACAELDAAWALDVAAAAAAADARLETTNSMGFEGGNAARVVRLAPDDYELVLRSDNDDALPEFWRQWWFARVDDVPTDRPVRFSLKGQGIWSFYVPAYSYDGEHWQLFAESEVDKRSRLDLRFGRRFSRSTIYVARYVPYTYSRLLGWLDGLRRRPGVELGDIGTSSEGRRIPRLTITDAAAPLARKSRVLVHARTHPGEVGSSFLLEGLVDYLSSPAARAVRRRLIVDIVPMLNVDGVVAGNNRVTPAGVNLEGKWLSRTDRPFLLDAAKVPKEVRLLHGFYAALSRDKAAVTVALNLHSSAGEPEDQVFFFPHFGPQARGYAPHEAKLYAKQLRFIDLWRGVQGRGWFNEPPVDGQRSFLAKRVPEAWWWQNFRDEVMALSIESVYGRAGGSRRWVQPRDMQQLGRSLGLALARYHGI